MLNCWLVGVIEIAVLINKRMKIVSRKITLERDWINDKFVYFEGFGKLAPQGPCYNFCWQVLFFVVFFKGFCKKIKILLLGLGLMEALLAPSPSSPLAVASLLMLRTYI